ncbi:MAG: LicD family protein, partial [Lachnospiraceae bacterium]|nr:LicD family protein [Lachnospiraceae bacterium]
MLPIKIDLPERFLEEEVRDGYTISTEMKANWAVQMDLLAEFDRVCKEHNIEYFACGGTLLGAVRHGGYIPWDDDIDLMITRDNYNKLCACGPTAFTGRYFFQTEDTDPGTLRNHAQLRNSETTGVIREEAQYKYQFNQGIFLDIFPLDNLPERGMEREKFLAKLRSRMRLAHAFALLTSRYTKTDFGGVKGKIIRVLGAIIHPIYRMIPVKNIFYAQLETCMQRYNDQQTEEIASLFVLDDRLENCIWKNADFAGEGVELDFEW